MITLFLTSNSVRYLGISNDFLKILLESHGGFLIQGEDYFLGVSLPDYISCDVNKSLKKTTIKVGSIEQA